MPICCDRFAASPNASSRSRGESFERKPVAIRSPDAMAAIVAEARAYRAVGPQRLEARGRAWNDIGFGGPASPAMLWLTLAQDLPGIDLDPEGLRLLVSPNVLTGDDYGVEVDEKIFVPDGQGGVHELRPDAYRRYEGTGHTREHPGGGFPARHRRASRRAVARALPHAPETSGTRRAGLDARDDGRIAGRQRLGRGRSESGFAVLFISGRRCCTHGADRPGRSGGFSRRQIDPRCAARSDAAGCRTAGLRVRGRLRLRDRTLARRRLGASSSASRRPPHENCCCRTSPGSAWSGPNRSPPARGSTCGTPTAWANRPSFRWFRSGPARRGGRLRPPAAGPATG